MVYTSDSSAAALLESCAHTSREDAPSKFTLLKIIGPDTLPEEVGSGAFPADWKGQLNLTQSIGADWLAAAKTALLRVPSALVPESWNYLLNPLHPEAGEFRIEKVYEYPFDLRLKG